ncbi:hypothetical protein ACP8HI_04600 [Paenibacillus sp. FA6]|uniref:hypothetical protein n=1 Tax=Paenibacillus sp. FA6 TaxID=3413029 RepID=UPI003F65CC55
MSISKMALASYNTIFMLRGIRPSVQSEVSSRIEEAFQQQEVDSAGHIDPPKIRAI